MITTSTPHSLSQWLGRLVPTFRHRPRLYQGRFAYHAWAEVQVESGWLSVDPTWAQLPADVGHLAFIRGGIGKQASLLRLMGKLTIEHASNR